VGSDEKENEDCSSFNRGTITFDALTSVLNLFGRAALVQCNTVAGCSRERDRRVRLAINDLNEPSWCAINELTI